MAEVSDGLDVSIVPADVSVAATEDEDESDAVEGDAVAAAGVACVGDDSPVAGVAEAPPGSPAWAVAAQLASAINAPHTTSVRTSFFMKLPPGEAPSAEEGDYSDSSETEKPAGRFRIVRQTTSVKTGKLGAEAPIKPVDQLGHPLESLGDHTEPVLAEVFRLHPERRGQDADDVVRRNRTIPVNEVIQVARRQFRPLGEGAIRVTCLGHQPLDGHAERFLAEPASPGH